VSPIIFLNGSPRCGAWLPFLCRRQTPYYLRSVAAGLLSEADISTVLHGAGADAGLDDREVGSMVAWAVAHPSSATLPDGVAS
jgi:hypothetical protein